LPDTKNQLDRLDPLVWKITAVAVLGSLMGQVDATVVNVSLSSLAVDLHSSLTTIQWVTSGYLLALALMLPLNGWLVGQLGAKSLYLWCFPIFTLSSALCGLAWSANSLIGFRVLQGMSGGLMAPLTQMMIVRAAGRHTARVFGYAAIPILLGPLLGPVLAGAILQHGSWRWLFLVNIPVGLLGIALGHDQVEPGNQSAAGLHRVALGHHGESKVSRDRFLSVALFYSPWCLSADSVDPVADHARPELRLS